MKQFVLFVFTASFFVLSCASGEITTTSEDAGLADANNESCCHENDPVSDDSSHGPVQPWSVSLRGKWFEDINQIIETRDHSLVLVGDSYSFLPTGELLAVKVDAQGRLLWQKLLVTNNRGVAESVLETDNGDLLIVGQFDPPDQTYNSDIWIVLLDSQGSLLWQKTLATSNWDDGADVAKTSDGNYLIVGRLNDQAGVIKVNPQGQLIWQKTISNIYRIASIVEVADGYFASTESGILKLNKQGEPIGYKVLPASTNAFLGKLSKTSDGGFVGGRFFFQSDSAGTGWTIKFSAAGEVQWQTLVGDDVGGGSDFWAVVETKPQQYAAVGSTSVTGPGDINNFLVRFNSSGQVLSQWIWGTVFHDEIFGLINTWDGGWVLVVNSRQSTLTHHDFDNVIVQKVADLAGSPGPCAGNDNISLSVVGPQGLSFTEQAITVLDANGTLADTSAALQDAPFIWDQEECQTWTPASWVWPMTGNKNLSPWYVLFELGESSAPSLGHLGEDYGHTKNMLPSEKIGLPVYAAASGTIAHVYKNIGNYVDIVVIRHQLAAPNAAGDSVLYLRYGHISSEVSEGQNVAAGQRIGALADPVVFQPHLHFEVVNETAQTQGPFCQGCPAIGVQMGSGYAGYDFDSSGIDYIDPSNDGIYGNRFYKAWRAIVTDGAL